MITFDAASREVCTARRINTNTPLQALTTLNDSAFLDLARNFAYRMQREGGDNVVAQIKRGYNIMTYHNIDNKSLQILLKLYNTAYEQFKGDQHKVCEINGGMNEHANAATAALTIVANAMLNLDEVVTKS
jgi:hypothetical protein